MTEFHKKQKGNDEDSFAALHGFELNNNDLSCFTQLWRSAYGCVNSL